MQASFRVLLIACFAIPCSLLFAQESQPEDPPEDQPDVVLSDKLLELARAAEAETGDYEAEEVGAITQVAGSEPRFTDALNRACVAAIDNLFLRVQSQQLKPAAEQLTPTVLEQLNAARAGSVPRGLVTTALLVDASAFKGFATEDAQKPTALKSAPIESLPLNEQIETAYKQLFNQQGVSDLASLYDLHLSQLPHDELLAEFDVHWRNSEQSSDQNADAKFSLFEEYLRLIEPTVSPEMNKQVDADALESELTLSVENLDQRQKAWSEVSREWEHVVRIDHPNAYYDFFRRRNAFKESLLARQRAYELYVKGHKASGLEPDTVAGYEEFRSRFPSGNPEFDAATVRWHRALYRDAERLASQDGLDGELDDWNTFTKVSAWDDSVIEAPSSSFVSAAMSRATEAAREIEKEYRTSNNLPASLDDFGSLPESQKQRLEERATELLQRGITLQNAINVSLGFSLTNSPLSGLTRDQLAKLRSEDALRLALQRDRCLGILTTDYLRTRAGTQLGILNLIASKIIEANARTSFYTAETIINEITLARKEIGESLASIATQLDGLNTTLISVRDELRDFRNSVDVQLAEIDHKIEGIAETSAQILATVEEIKIDVENIAEAQKQQIREFARLRSTLLPPPWPGTPESKDVLREQNLPDELRGAMAGALEERLRKAMADQSKLEFNGSHRYKKRIKKGWVDVTLWSITIKYNGDVEFLPNDTHFNITSAKLGFDKRTRTVHLFVEATAKTKVKAKARGEVPRVGSTGYHKVDATARCDAKIRLSLIGDSLEWEAEVEELNLEIENLDFRGDVFNWFRGQLKDRANAALDEREGDTTEKINKLVNEQGAQPLRDEMQKVKQLADGRF